MLPSYSSASEEDEVQSSVVEEEQVQVPAIVKEGKQVLNEEVKIPEEEEQVPVPRRSSRMHNVPNLYLPRRRTRATNQLRLSSRLRDNSMVRDLIINVDDSLEDKGKEVKKKVPVVKQKPRKRVTRSEGLKLLFSAIDSLN